MLAELKKRKKTVLQLCAAYVRYHQMADGGPQGAMDGVLDALGDGERHKL